MYRYNICFAKHAHACLRLILYISYDSLNQHVVINNNAVCDL
jgi:hypothetical protein